MHACRSRGTYGQKEPPSTVLGFQPNAIRVLVVITAVMTTTDVVVTDKYALFSSSSNQNELRPAIP